MTQWLSIATAVINMGCGPFEQRTTMDILSDLEKSYVKNIVESAPLTDFLDEYGKTKDQFEQDKIVYQQAVADFYDSSPEIIGDLLSFERDSNSYCHWIETPRRFSSRINKDDLVTKSRAALALIDCYIINDKRQVLQINDHLRHINYQELRSFYATRMNFSRKKLRKDYLAMLLRDKQK